MLLQALYENLKSKDRILTRKRVTHVHTVEGCVHVQTEDGSTYTGDIVVGADGVHSAVRKEMQRNSLESSPNGFQADKGDGSSSRAQDSSSKSLLTLLLQGSHLIRNAYSASPNGLNHFPKLHCKSTHFSTAEIT